MGNEDNGELRRVTEMIVNRIEIDSDTLLEDIDSHFKVVAEPGSWEDLLADKTREERVVRVR